MHGMRSGGGGGGGGAGIDCIPNHMHISRYSKFNRARLFAKLPAEEA